MLFAVSEHPEENKRGDKRGADGLQGSGFGVKGKSCSLSTLRSPYKCVRLACLRESGVSHCLTDFLLTEPLTNRQKLLKQGSFFLLDNRFVFFPQIIDECNTQVGKMRQMEELIQINHSLEFDKLKVRMEMPKWPFVVGI